MRKPTPLPKAKPKGEGQQPDVIVVDNRVHPIIIWLIRAALLVSTIGAALMSLGVWDVVAVAPGEAIGGDSADGMLSTLIVVLGALGFSLTFTIKERPMED